MDATRTPAHASDASSDHDDYDDEEDESVEMGMSWVSDSDDDDDDDDDRAEEDEGQDEDDAATLPTGRWAFMADIVECWFQSLKYADAPTSTIVDPRFETFLVHLPWAATPDGDASRRKLLYATELVAYMLCLDPTTWWYAKRRYRPWFEGYDPSQYDPLELVPTMTFALSQMMGPNDDQLDAVQRLHFMLADTDTSSPEYAAYATAKKRLLEMEDPDSKLRGFQIPTRIKLQPPAVKNADELRSYLRGAIVAVRAFKEKCASQDVSTPFRFDAVELRLYIPYSGDAMTELRELLSLGVPRERANGFPALADPPALEREMGESGSHTMDSRFITSSYELWSAAAYAATLRNVRVRPHDYTNPEYDEQIARWMAYAVVHSTSLRSLKMDGFRMTEKELDAMEAVLTNPVPFSLLPSATQSPKPKSGPMQLVCFKPNVVLQCEPGGELNGYGNEDRQKQPVAQTLAQLDIPDHWQFPVVQRAETSLTIQVIVPGHGICEVPTTDIASIHELPPPNPLGESRWRSNLTELVIHNDFYCEAGKTGRFVRLVGRELRSLRWDGGDFEWNGIQFDQVLLEMERSCPELESLSIKQAKLESIVPLASLSLCELSLVNTAVPTPALVACFRVLADKTAPIAQTLERFTYYCPKQQLCIDAVDAAVEMLAKNHRLYSVTLGLDDAIFDENEARFDAVEDVDVTIEKLPLANKLAFLRVVQHYARQQPHQSIGQLDSGCVGSVFQFFVRTPKRRIQLLRGAE